MTPLQAEKVRQVYNLIVKWADEGMEAKTICQRLHNVGLIRFRDDYRGFTLRCSPIVTSCTGSADGLIANFKRQATVKLALAGVQS